MSGRDVRAWARWALVHVPLLAGLLLVQAVGLPLRALFWWPKWKT